MAALAQSLCFAAPAHPCAMAGMQKDCRNNPCPGVVSLPLETRGRAPLGARGHGRSLIRLYSAIMHCYLLRKFPGQNDAHSFIFGRSLAIRTASARYWRCSLETASWSAASDALFSMTSSAADNREPRSNWAARIFSTIAEFVPSRRLVRSICTSSVASTTSTRSTSSLPAVSMSSGTTTMA